MNVVDNFVMLFAESAPYLLLGMLIAGAIHHLLPDNFVQSLLGKRANAVFTASIIGAPLPLCSCSVIPVAMGIRRSGASKASTASFLVSTPETGVDSIGITYALMGPVMAIARPIAAIFSAIITGFSIVLWGNETDQKGDVAKNQQENEQDNQSSCCASQRQCGSKPSPKPGFVQQTRNVVQYGFDKLLADFMTWLLIGLVFAALIITYVPQDWMASYGSGPIAMIMMVLISIPMYICATASTPIAVGLMLAGISPGAALVFMLTGPATNIATLMVIKKELGGRELGLYLVSLIASALLCGWLLDWLFTTFSWTLNLSHGEHSMVLNWIHNASAVVLAGLMAWQIYKKLRQHFDTKKPASCCGS